MKPIIGLILLAIIIFSGWLFWWPLVESWYALSWDPLLTDTHKLLSWIGGGCIFWPATLFGWRIIV